MEIKMKFFINILRGTLIGIANAVPGVSGGTMMVSMGIYDEIIGCITGVFTRLRKSILTLLPYAIGMALGVVGLSYSIQFFLTGYPFLTSMTFIGLILGGIPLLYSHVKGEKKDIFHGLVFLVFFLFLLGTQILGQGDGTEADISFGLWNFIKLFFVGVVAAGTMVIPGVSGSMMLMLLGYYYPILKTVTLAVDGLGAGNWGQLLSAFGVLFPMGLGVLLGIFGIAELIEYLLEHYKGYTYCGILGLVLASPIVILMEFKPADLTIGAVLGSIPCFLVGFVVAYILGRE
jgi:putative membrane protein